MKELIELGFETEDGGIFTRDNINVNETKVLDGYKYVIAWDVWKAHKHLGTYTDLEKMVSLIKNIINKR